MKQWFTVRGEKGDFFKEVSIMGFTYSFTFNFLILLLVCLAVSAVGFYKYVYFLSIGYGFAVSGIGVAMAVMMGMGILPASLPTVIYCVLFFIYGLRLSGFLLVREIKNAS